VQLLKTKLIIVLGVEVIIIASSLLWGGCIPLPQPPHYPPQTALVHMTMDPAMTYRYVYANMVQFGGTITSHDEQMHALSAEVHNAVTMRVLIQPEGTGSQIAIYGSIMPNKVVVGDFDEVSTFATLLQGGH